MANQMIALTGRPFQAPNLMGAAQQLGTFMTQRAQQEAAASQRDAARQKMDFERQMQDPQMREANLKAMNAEQKVMTDFFDISARVINAAQTPEDLRYGADLLKQQFNAPIFQHFVDQTIRTMPEDPAAFPAWRNQTKFETLSAKDQVPYLVEQLKSQSIIGEDGSVGVLTTGGFGAPTIKTPRSMVPAPPRKGTVSVEPSQTVEPGVGGPANADEVERFIQSFPPAAQPAIRQRVNEGALGNIPMGSPVGPQGLVAGPRGGMGGPYAAVEDGYVEASKPFRAKNPALAPYPGSAQVPISRVREEAAAGRKTPAETYAEKRSEKQAMSDVDFLDAYESSKTDAQNILSVIDQMIGDLNVDKQGRVIRGKRKPHPGFESVVGAGVPGLRFIPGTQSADFDAFLEQVQGGAFLKAYNALRGTGQITEKEGEKATTALSRMKRSQSEAGFIKAAREFEGLVRSAMERADRRAARLRGTQPTRKNNIDDLLKMYGD